MRSRSLPARLSLLMLAIVGGCATPKPVPPAPVPVIVPRPVAPPAPATTDWRDWPVTPGDWSYRKTTLGSQAVFGQGSPNAITLECGNDHRVHLYRPWNTAVAIGAMTVRTTSMVRTEPIQLIGHPPDAVGISLASSDPLLDAMGYSRGRFVIEQAGAPTLVIPAWAEVLRVTEDCRG